MYSPVDVFYLRRTVINFFKINTVDRYLKLIDCGMIDADYVIFNIIKQMCLSDLF